MFDLGQIATPSALAACSRDYMAQCLARHVRGDWGVIDAEDRKENFDAMFSGESILSAYPIDPAKPCEGFGANTLWIITEGDRSATTLPAAGRVLTRCPGPHAVALAKAGDRVLHHHQKKEVEND